MAEGGAIVVIGAGGHARVLAEAIRLAGLRLAGHVAPQAGQGLGDWLGDDAALAKLAAKGHRFALGIGFVDAAGAGRRAAILAGLPGAMATVCHPQTVVSPSAVLADGVFVAAGAVVGTGTRLGAGVIVNSGAVVDHDGDIGPNSHIATGARIAGGVTIGRDVLIGAGAVLRQGLRIGAGTVIGAGAVVVADVAEGALMLGNPARARGAR